MLFVKLGLQHISMLKDSLYKFAPNKANDYTLTGLFMWRDYLNAYVAKDGDDIYIYQLVEDRCLFYFPLCNDVRTGLKKIVSYAQEQNINYGFYPLCKDEIQLLDEMNLKYTIIYSEDYRDYLYQRSDLITYSGKKYHSQRNHLNRFLINNPNYKFERINEHNLWKVKEFFGEYRVKYPYKDETEKEEYIKIPELLDNMDEYKIFGYYLEINDSIEGFELGEVVNDMYYSHVQKANVEIQGIYATIVNLMVKELPDLVKYINREEDMGNEGLRTAKQRYRPCGYVEKYMIICEGV
jgi:hypothetical protein